MPELLSRAGGAVVALSRATKTFQIFQNVQNKIPEMRVGTFNVRGMSSKVKQTQLASDMLSHRLDFCGLQETKIAESLCRMVSEQHRFVNFGQVEGRHGGTGFVVSKRLEPCLTQYKKLSDRAGYADFVIPSGGMSKNVIDVRFAVAYGPTTPSVQKDSNLLEKFDDTLSRAQLIKSAGCMCTLSETSTAKSEMGQNRVWGNTLKDRGMEMARPLWIGHVHNDFCWQILASDIP